MGLFLELEMWNINHTFNFYLVWTTLAYTKFCWLITLQCNVASLILLYCLMKKYTLLLLVLNLNHISKSISRVQLTNLLASCCLVVLGEPKSWVVNGYQLLAFYELSPYFLTRLHHVLGKYEGLSMCSNALCTCEICLLDMSWIKISFGYNHYFFM